MAEVTLQEAVQKYAHDLAEQVSRFVKDISELEVRTFTTPNDQVNVLIDNRPDLDEMATKGNIALRAYTKISLDGDTTVCVPQDANGEVDRSVWGIHQTMVQLAMTNRATMLRAMGDAASAALSALRKANE